MHIPAAYLQLLKDAGLPAPTIEPVEDYALVYPPIGFLPWSICSMGNGDDYGYYWPIGRENDLPVVALMSHDYGALNPISSSIEAAAQLERFLDELAPLLPSGHAAADSKQSAEEFTHEERLSIDPQSPQFLVALADELVGKNELAAAEENYSNAISVLPEYTAAHYGLVTVYRHQRRPNLAAVAMLDSIRSPLCFRGASWWASTHLSVEHVNRQDYRRKCLHWLRQTRPSDAGELADDPLFVARDRLTFATGVTTNDDFRIYDEAIDIYTQRSQSRNAVSLAMSAAELMMGETTPFRERYSFTASSLRDKMRRLFQQTGLHERCAFLGGQAGSSTVVDGRQQRGHS